MSNQHRFLRVKEAAEFLRVSVPTIRKWIRVGKLQPHRAGRVILFERDDLLRLLGAKITTF